MKKIYLFIIPLFLLLVSCSKGDAGYQEPIDEAYWLQQERGYVEYSDWDCDYFVVYTNRGYSILRSWGMTPYRGSILYGNFSSWGTGRFYNRSEGYIGTGEVRDYWLSYYMAQDQLNWYCR